jgi:hypothetical protein
MQELGLGQIKDTSEYRVGKTVGILNSLNILWIVFIIMAVTFDRKGYLIFDEEAEKM